MLVPYAHPNVGVSASTSYSSGIGDRSGSFLGSRTVGCTDACRLSIRQRFDFFLEFPLWTETVLPSASFLIEKSGASFLTTVFRILPRWAARPAHETFLTPGLNCVAGRVDVITEAALHWNEAKGRGLARSLVDRYAGIYMAVILLPGASTLITSQAQPTFTSVFRTSSLRRDCGYTRWARPTHQLFRRSTLAQNSSRLALSSISSPRGLPCVNRFCTVKHARFLGQRAGTSKRHNTV